ncbi:MAG: EF-hand domain-containing protein [Alphaproteobacteria bacterium]|nr:EF-hand domain-containing protein [Alphaproteobacteria bacterium]
MKTFKNIALLSTVAVLGLGFHGAQAQVGLSVGADTSAETNVGTTANDATSGINADADIDASADADTSTSTSSAADADVDTDMDGKADMEFSAVDSNKDGTITESEFSNSVKADMATSSFAELDSDGNGSLSEAEFDVMAGVDSAVSNRTMAK